MTRILDGSRVAADVERAVAARVQRLRTAGVHPGLAVVLFGDDPASRVYGAMIQRGAGRVGIDVRVLFHPERDTLAEASALLDSLNRDSAIHGILVKRPLAAPLDDESVLQQILPAKDVDGCHFENIGRLVIGGAHHAPVPCTPAAVLALLKHSNLATAGKHVVVLGRSTTVGRPLSILLAQKESGANATVTLCHSHTRDLERHTLAADIVIASIGRARFVTRAMIAATAVVIDVGTNFVPDPSAKTGSRQVGDCDYEALVGHCAAITPVPGGVGPVTVAMLLSNVVDAAQNQSGVQIMTGGLSRRALLAALPATACIGVGAATGDPKYRVLVLTRHAEKGVDDPSDPELSKLGAARAARLADLLANSGATRLLASDKKRTRSTLAPLAERLHLEVTTLPAADVDAWIAALANPEHAVTIAASHSNVIPRLTAAFGARLARLDGDGNLPDGEYGRLVVMTLNDQAEHPTAASTIELMQP